MKYIKYLVTCVKFWFKPNYTIQLQTPKEFYTQLAFIQAAKEAKQKAKNNTTRIG